MGSKSRLSPSDITRLIRMKADAALNSNDTSSLTPAASRHSIVSNIPRGVTSGQYSLITQFFGIRPPPSGFTPTSINGLALWLDAADREALTLSGSSVTNWLDKSPRGNNFVTAAGYQIPNYNNSGMNGRPTVSFFRNNSASFSVLQNTAFSGLSGQASLTFLMVSRRTGGSTNEYPRFLSAATTTNGNDSSNVGAFDIAGVAGGRFGIQRNGDTFSGTGSFNTGNVFLGEVILNGTGSNVGNFQANRTYTYANGSQIAFSGMSAGSNFNVSHVRLGAATQSPANNDGDVGTLQGNISEMIVFNRVLTTSEFTSVEGYLAWKWGLQASLPSNHPYFTAKP